MTNYVNKLSCLYIEQRNYLSGSLVSIFFHKQTEYTLIRQFLQELPDLGLPCLQKCSKASLLSKG